MNHLFKIFVQNASGPVRQSKIQEKVAAARKEVGIGGYLAICCEVDGVSWTHVLLWNG